MKLPAGLENKSVEIYAFENKLKALYNGKVIEFEQLPDHIRELYANKCLSSTDALKAMESVGITNLAAKVHQFVFCNFGGFNEIPDLDENGTLTSEYWDCGQRKTCIFSGKICGAMVTSKGVVSNREVEVIRLLQQGLKNKEIGAVLGISVNTICNHIANLNRKTETGTRQELLNWASINNLI